MGGAPSSLSEKEISHFTGTTFLGRGDVLDAHARFLSLQTNNHIQMDTFCELPEFVANPFATRVFEVFTPTADGMPLENWMQLVSVFSANGTLKTKKMVAFRVFDFDGDHSISKYDVERMLKIIMGMVDLRVEAGLRAPEPKEALAPEDAEKAAEQEAKEQEVKAAEAQTVTELVDEIFKAVDLDGSAELSEQEFGRILEQIPDFDLKFTVKLVS